MDHGRNGLPGSLAFSSKLVAIDVICKKCIERKVSQETFKSFPLVVVEMLEAKSKMKPSNSRTHHPWFAWLGQECVPSALTCNQRLKFVHENIPNIDLVGLQPIPEQRKHSKLFCKVLWVKIKFHFIHFISIKKHDITKLWKIERDM